MTEYKWAIKKSDPNNGIVVDVAKESAQYCLDRNQGCKASARYLERIMEAIEIKRSKSSMNLDKGLLFPSVLNSVLD